MDSSLMQPSAFSDTVIGHVVPRSWNARSSPTGRILDTGSTREKHQYRQHHTTHQNKTQEYWNDTLEDRATMNNRILPGPANFSSVAEPIGRIDSTSGHKRKSCISSDLQTTKMIIGMIHERSDNISTELQQAIVAEALKKKALHRMRNRMYYARCRDKRLQTEKGIQIAIFRLQYDIEELKKKCQDLLHVPTTPTVWDIAA